MSAQQDMLKKYGSPDGLAYQQKLCTIWSIEKDFPELKGLFPPSGRVMINKDFKTKLNATFLSLRAKGLIKEIKTFDGCFNSRAVRGRSSTSLHAWAAAIDLNAATEKLAQNTTNWSDEFLKTFRENGLFCGADWHGRKDSMHFALFNG